VFGFHNCIAFHKHEHHSSHSCLYFVCNMSMQHTLICLFIIDVFMKCEWCNL
jgi:hypothetical protein